MAEKIRESFMENMVFRLDLEGGLEFQQVEVQAQGLTESRKAEARKYRPFQEMQQFQWEKRIEWWGEGKSQPG